MTFTAGARVAVVSGYAPDLSSAREDVVLRVHKNGNFAIRTRDGQHKPAKRVVADGLWSAIPTGQEALVRYTHVVYLWDDNFERAINRDRALKDRKERQGALATWYGSKVFRALTVSEHNLTLLEQLRDAIQSGTSLKVDQDDPRSSVGPEPVSEPERELEGTDRHAGDGIAPPGDPQPAEPGALPGAVEDDPSSLRRNLNSDDEPGGSYRH